MSDGLDRRQFLATTAGLTLVFAIPGGRVRTAAAATAFTPNAWLTITPDGVVTIHSDWAEMGQGILTAMAQIVAEELEVDWTDVRVDFQTYEPKHGVVVTAGSIGVARSFDTLSRAGAAARIMLIDAAARHWHVDAADCSAERGIIRHAPTGRSISFGDVVARVPITKTLTPDELKAIPLKKPGQYRLVGKWIQRLDIPEKVDGRARFGIDVFLPGMTYAAVAYPPTREGARLRNVDDTAGRRVKGWVKTVVIGDLVAAVAETYEAAVEARDALAVNWDPGPLATLDSAGILRDYEQRAAQEPGVVWANTGDVGAAMAQAATSRTASYVTDFTAHAQIEPTNCVAHYENGILHLFTGTQSPVRVTNVLARQLGIERTNIRIHQQQLGGAFGRKIDEDTELEAALIARETGRPIKLIRSREEDFQRGFYRPLTLQTLHAGFDGAGRIMAWDHLYVGASALARLIRLAPSVPDPQGLKGSNHYYEIPNRRVRAIRVQQGIPAGSYRGVDSGYAGFAVETFIDEVAHSLKADSLTFRLGLLTKQARLSNVLRIVAARSGWGAPLPPATGRGVAVAPAWPFGQTWMAVVVQARVEQSSGQVRVEKITCALDCGLVVNPDGVRAQTEGALLFGLSTALKERGSIAKGALEQKNFDEYEILRMDEVPEVEIHVVESPERPTGVGEPGTAAMAPALGNAIFAATGVRLRHLPFLPTRLWPALKALKDKA